MKTIKEIDQVIQWVLAGKEIQWKKDTHPCPSWTKFWCDPDPSDLLNMLMDKDVHFRLKPSEPKILYLYTISDGCQILFWNKADAERRMLNHKEIATISKFVEVLD